MIRIVFVLVLKVWLYKSSFKYTVGDCSFAFVCGINLFSRLKTDSLPLLSGNSFILYEQIS